MTHLITAIDDMRIALLADGRAEKTVNGYVWLLAYSPAAPVRWLLTRFDIQNLETVRTADLRRYIVWLREEARKADGSAYARETVNDYVRALHRFFKWAAAEYSVSNPMHRIAFPKTVEKRPKAAELDDVRRLLAACSGADLASIRNRAIVYLLIDTGIRAAGLCGLTVPAIDQARRMITVIEKGERIRAVPYSERCALALDHWLISRDTKVIPVFYNVRTLRALTPSGLRQILQKTASRAGITGRINPHSFRHAFAREWLMSGGDLASLAKHLGHRDVQTTIDHYIHFSDDELRRKHDQHSPATRL